jgi:single-strand DNA-binding protein
MNKAQITGNLVRDVETKQTKTGKTFAVWTVAVNIGFGENQTTAYTRCMLFGKRAESGLINYLKKGQPVAVAGSFEVEGYKKKDGTPGASLTIFVDDVDLLGKRDESAAAAPASTPQPAQSMADLDSDDIPF